ncbi:unnamed protein product [Amoebophrya sp. A25]|nr:unnamed protein product [Amoebophrya sp. A25]CAD7932766.1 unnamed protein product [Amoebophrya sp. A25]|eukprot:GSA25T00015075001.1
MIESKTEMFKSRQQREGEGGPAMIQRVRGHTGLTLVHRLKHPSRRGAFSSNGKRGARCFSRWIRVRSKTSQFL